MGLPETIVSRKNELVAVDTEIILAVRRKIALETKIADLEYQFKRQEENKLKNYHACIIVTQLIDNGGCKGCDIEDRCSYEGRGRKFKL